MNTTNDYANNACTAGTLQGDPSWFVYIFSSYTTPAKYPKRRENAGVGVGGGRGVTLTALFLASQRALDSLVLLL